MKFTIVTPCFNGLSDIRRCVGSVRGQKGVEREHLIADGASRDGTVEYLTAFERRIKDASEDEAFYAFRYFSEPDRGMYDAINKGWAESDGDILSWLNHDEQYLPGTLRRVENYFKAHPEVDALFGNMIIVMPDGRPMAARREIPLRAFYVKNDFLYAISCTIFFRRALRERGWLNCDPDFRNAGDMELMLRLMSKGVRVAHVPEYLALFTARGDNLTVALGDNMAREIASIRKQYGGFSSSWMRRGVKTLRWIERLLHGCYRRADLTYDVAADDRPTYMRQSARRVGWRFTYERAARQLQKEAAERTADNERNA